MEDIIKKHNERMMQLDSSIASGKLSDDDASLIIENVLDILMEVGNGATDDELHKAAHYLFALRDKWFQKRTNTDWVEEEEMLAAKDNAVLAYVKSKVTPEVYGEILEELEECYYTYYYSIIKKPEGVLEERDEYEYIEGVYVNQTTNGGYTGDEFAGTCAIKISEDEYFQFHYSM